MSSISNVVRCAANAAANKAKNLHQNDESELAYLNEKPSIGRKAGTKKSKRNNFIKYMQKRDGTTQLVEKVLINDSKLSKKRRAKLLTNLNDDLNLQIPYSLNRKNRWEDVETAADLVKNSSEPDDVIVSGIDCRVSMSDNGTVSGYHEMSNDGVKSKICVNVMNGTNVESLRDSLNQKDKKSKKKSKRLAYKKIVNNDDDDDDVSDDKPQIRYIISKPHTVSALYGGFMYKQHNNSNSNKLIRNKNYKLNEYLNDLDTSYVEDESEIDITSSIASYYRSPRQNSFSLGDFIKDSTPAVLVNYKSIESLNEQCCINKNNDNNKTTTFNEIHQQQQHQIDENKLCKNTLYLEFDIEKSKLYGNHDNMIDTFEILENDKDLLRFKWLNNDKTKCIFDLTKKLDEHTTKIALIVVIEELRSKEGFLRVLLNGSFGCPEGVVIDILKEKSYKSINEFIDKIMNKLQKWYNKSQEDKKQLNSLISLNSVYHGHQLTKQIEPYGDYKIIDESLNNNPTIEAIMIDVVENDDDDLDDHDNDDMDYDEFEIIDIDEVISDDENDNINDDDNNDDEIEILPDFGNGCDFCDIDNNDDIIMLDDCEHKFCKRCLKDELTKNIVRQTAYPLTCLHEKCTSSINMNTVLTLVPLPLAEYYLRFAFMAENVANGKTVVECPHCQDLASIGEKPLYGSVKCNKCSISFCFKCQRQPHYPLTCQQMSIWEEKFDKQFSVDLCRQSVNGNKKCSCGELLQNDKNQPNVTCSGCNVTYVWKTGESTGKNATKTKNLEIIDVESMPNNISGEFSQICSQAKSLRFNLVSNRQITKKMCKSVDFRMKQGFIEIRKTALHLIEFGFAWLYLNRNDKPANYSTVKNNLSNLRNKLEQIHTNIDCGQTDGIETKINELNHLVIKVMEEFNHQK